jgi:hypothetical protein
MHFATRRVTIGVVWDGTVGGEARRGQPIYCHHRPEECSWQMFEFYALCGKGPAIMGPLVQRLGIVAVGAFFERYRDASN